MTEITIRDLQMALLGILEEFDCLCNDYNLQYTFAAGTLLGAVRHKGFIPWDDDMDLFMPRDSFDKLMNIDDESIAQRGYTLQRPFTKTWPSGYAKFCKNNTTYIENYQYKNKDQHHGIFIDIIPVDNLSDNTLRQKLQWISYRIITAKALANRGYSTNSFVKKAAMTIAKGIPNSTLKKIVINTEEKTSKKVHCFFGVAHYFERNIFPRETFENYVRIDFEGRKFPVMENYKDVLTTQYGDYMKLPPKNERVAAVHAVAIDLTRSWSDEEIEKVMQH